MDITYIFTIQRLAISDVFNITKDEVRIVFSSPISSFGVDIVGNYVFSPSSVYVNRVLMPRNSNGELSYIDIYVTGLEHEKTYTLTVNNLYSINGFALGTQIATFRAEITKTSRIIDGLPSMYNTEVDSNLRHLLLAIGISDDQIGGTRVKRLQS